MTRCRDDTKTVSPKISFSATPCPASFVAWSTSSR